jgi:hypothetical protein
VYAQKKVDERLALAEKEFKFLPTYHSVQEVDNFEKQLTDKNKYMRDDSGKIVGMQGLTARDRWWIENEQILVQCDAAYFLTRYSWVRDEENIIRRFNFRAPQKMIFDIICDLEKRDSAIEILILKARQLGTSTLIELLISHRIIFSYGVNAVIGSADQTKTALMANMLFLCYDYLPFWLKPQPTRRVESDRGMMVFGHSQSGVSFQHGAQTSGIARGTTPTIYHLSEVASFTDAVNQIEASLFKAVHASPLVFGILESTGEGDKGWWPDTWRHAKENWPLRRSRLCPLFLPWFVGVDMYPKPTWMKMRPVPHDWRPNRVTKAHVAKSELFVASNKLLERVLLEHQRKQGIEIKNHLWKMPREQQWFWEVEHEQARSKGIESVFLQEMAGDDEEALQRSMESVFGHETIETLQTRRDKDYHAYTITGQSIEEGHEVSAEYYDYSKDRIPVRYASKRGEIYRWDFIPLKRIDGIRENEPDDADRVLFIWHHPKQGVSYSIGVDTSEGKGEDSTVISVWTYGSKNQPDTQCAEFSSPYVNHVEAFAFVLSIAAYYGRYMERGITKWKEPYVAVEQVAAVGDTCQLQMARMGYSNFHRMSRYDGRHPARDKRNARKIGWFTFGWSRPLLTTNFVHAAQNGWAEINSPWLIEEMRHFEVHKTSTGKERLEHEEGEHDDRIFAAAMAIFCPHDLDVIADRSKKRHIETSALPKIDLGEYQGNMVSTSGNTRKSAVTLEEIMYSDVRDLERYR